MGRRKQLPQARTVAAVAIDGTPLSPAKGPVQGVNLVDAIAAAMAKQQLERSKPHSADETVTQQEQEQQTIHRRRRGGSFREPPPTPPPDGVAADVVRHELRALHEERLSTGRLPHAVAHREDEIAGQFYCLAEQGQRQYMEDRFSTDAVDERSGFADDVRLYGVYDGHGGDLCAELCAAQLLPLLRAQPELESDTETAICNAFESLDALFCEFSHQTTSSHIQDGCTATVAVVRTKPDGAQTVTVGHVGDSRCIFVDGERAATHALTRDHAAGLPDERARIEQQGGFLLRCGGLDRVQGCLAVSRALGDAPLKPFVSSTPETTTVHVPAAAAQGASSSSAMMLCIATDGVWDEMSSSEVGAMLLKHGCTDGARRALDTALRRGSEDNMTIMAVDLRGVAADAVAAMNRAAADDAVSHSTSSAASAVAGAAAAAAGDATEGDATTSATTNNSAAVPSAATSPAASDTHTTAAYEEEEEETTITTTTTERERPTKRRRAA